MKHEDCSTDANCCGDSNAPVCRLSPGFGPEKKKVCMGANECNAWENHDCDAVTNPCCNGMDCKFKASLGKNVCGYS